MNVDKYSVAESFGKIIQELRGKRNISQENLALEIEMARSYLSELERGVKQPTLSTIFALSEGLKFKASTIVSLVEKDLKR